MLHLVCLIHRITPLTSVSTELHACPYLQVLAVFGREGVAVHLISTSPFHSKQRLQVSHNGGKDTTAVTIHYICLLYAWGNPLRTCTQGCDVPFAMITRQIWSSVSFTTFWGLKQKKIMQIYLIFTCFMAQIKNGQQSAQSPYFQFLYIYPKKF